MIEYENLGKLNGSFEAGYAEAFQRVVKSGWYILGNEVQTFETSFAQFLGGGFCVGVANGLDALMLALRSLELEPGDEVLVPSNTYIATILAIVNEGLKPILIEPNISTYNMDPERIPEAITPRTRVIMPVHLYGKCCDMESIMKIAIQHQLFVVEDAAQAHGAHQNGRMAGTFGTMAAFSFYPTKNLGALGDAGAVTTSDGGLHEKLRMLRNYGSKKKYFNEMPGLNSRLDELQASFLSHKLKFLNDINNHKRRLADLYHAGLKSDFIKPVIQDGYFDVYHIYNIRHDRRDDLREFLLSHDVRTEIHYPVSPAKQHAMKGILHEVNTPIADEIHRTTLSLPISYFHSASDIEYVIDIMNKF